MGKATIKSSGNKYSSEKVVGLTVSDVRDQLGENLDISSESVATLKATNQRLDDDYVIQADDEVVFSRATGIKG